MTGTIHKNDAFAVQAKTDLASAYNAIAGDSCSSNLSGQNLGGLTLTPGVYCFSSAASLTGTLTLNAQGTNNAVFIFQIGSALTTASSSSVVMTAGGNACNVFWKVGSSATLGADTAFSGNILALASITLGAGASVTGGALARNAAVTLDANHVGACASYPQITQSELAFASKMINNTATTLHKQFGASNLGTLVPKAFNVIKGDSEFNSTVSTYGGAHFSWGVDYKLDVANSLYLHAEFAKQINGMFDTVTWDVSLENDTDNGPKVTSSTPSFATTSIGAYYSGFSYQLANSHPVGAVGGYTLTDSITEPPSGQIAADYDAVAGVWIGLTNTYSTGQDLVQTGYASDATTSWPSAGYSGIFWEVVCTNSNCTNGGNSITLYDSDSYAAAGDELYFNIGQYSGEEYAYEACDETQSGAPCWDEYYTTPDSGFTPYYAEFVTEAYTTTSQEGYKGPQQIAEFSSDSGSYGSLWFSSYMNDAGNSNYFDNPPNDGTQALAFYMQQSSSGQNTGDTTDDYTVNNLDTTWVSSDFSASYMCSQYGFDC